MSNSPDPFKSRLLRSSGFGVALAVFGIAAFVALWSVLGGAGWENAPRLFASLCIPPLLIGLVIGVYALVGRRS